MLKNLPTKVVSAVFKTKLRKRFIGPFTVIAKKELAYTLSLPCKLHTHTVLYVGLIKPYRDPSHVDLEALASTKRSSNQIAECKPAGLHEPRSRLVRALKNECELALRPSQTGSYPEPLARSLLELPTSNGPPTVHRPPPTLLNAQRNRQF